MLAPHWAGEHTENQVKVIGTYLTVLVFTTIALAACARSRPADQPALDGTSWELTVIDGVSPIESARPMLEFEGGQISGNAGCNSYAATYQVDGDAIEFSGLFNTERSCAEPVGVMQQEQLYLDVLRSAQRFDLANGRLTIMTLSDQTASFGKQGSIAESTPLPNLAGAPSEPPPAFTAVPTFQPPANFTEYRDVVTGISISIPESWHVTGVIAGEYAILQSYPPDKYVGGEARDPGDAKCDLDIRPPGATLSDIVQGWEASDRTTILSKTEISLGSGEPGTRCELDSMGRASVILTKLDQRVVSLTCFGDLTLFDQISATLRGAN